MPKLKELLWISYSEPPLNRVWLCPYCNSPLHVQRTTFTYVSGEQKIDQNLYCEHCSYWLWLTEEPD